MSNAELSEEQRAAVAKAAADAGIGEDDVAWLLSPKGQLAVFRPASAAEYQRFVEQVSDKDKKNKVSYMRQLAFACRLSPDSDALAAMFDRFPGLAPKAADLLFELAGGEAAGGAGKA